ncbi:Tetratricopeptide repeat protein [compost metagenome]
MSVLPNAPQLHFNLGVAREDVGAPQSALAAYERCIELAPDDADAHYNAARLHQELGHFQKALRHFNAFRRLDRP